MAMHYAAREPRALVSGKGHAEICAQHLRNPCSAAFWVLRYDIERQRAGKNIIHQQPLQRIQPYRQSASLIHIFFSR